MVAGKETALAAHFPATMALVRAAPISSAMISLLGAGGFSIYVVQYCHLRVIFTLYIVTNSARWRSLYISAHH